MNTVDLGIIEYRAGLKEQEHYHELVAAKSANEALIFCEHPPVITLGKHNEDRWLISSKRSLALQGIDVVATDRGGQPTAHEPGQLVVYPIICLADRRLTVRSYVELLEDAIIETCHSFGVQAQVVDGFPGCWVSGRKIASIGVRIRSRTTMHGIALNVNNSLASFEHIVPCGIEDVRMTSLARELSAPPSMGSVKKAFNDCFRDRLLVISGG